MKKEIMEKWVEALRSGEYKQGQEYLKNGNEFCCLGVLCDISGLGNWDSTDRYLGDNYLGMACLLPDEVMVWSGLGATNGSFSEGESLVELNDRGALFSEIADVIEKNYERI